MMLLVEGVSDGGGGAVGSSVPSLLLAWGPVLLSAFAVSFTAWSLVVNTRKSARDSIASYLQLLVSADASEARSVVGSAAAVNPGRALAHQERVLRHQRSTIRVNRGDPGADDLAQLHATYRDAIFQMLWLVSLATPVLETGSYLHRLVVGRSTDLYRAQVYEHLALIVPDLHVAFDIWAPLESSGGSARLANLSLERLPKSQSYGDGRTINLPEERFRLPKDGELEGGDSA